MNKEYLMIAAMGAGGILGAIGGTGYKWARRYILPAVLGGLALWSGVIWWKALILFVGFMLSSCLPYGERTPYWLKFLAGCAFVAPTLILGFSWWQIITPCAFIAMFALSNWKPTSKVFFWKAVEFLTFGLVGVTVASLL